MVSILRRRVVPSQANYETSSSVDTAVVACYDYILCMVVIEDKYCHECIEWSINDGTRRVAFTVNKRERGEGKAL
jgi:hypothetical protein